MQDEPLNQQHSMETNDKDKLSVESHAREDNSGSWSYRSTILAGQAADAESQGSTENSYRTAQSGSTAGCSSSHGNFIESCRSEVPSSLNRAIDVEFVPQSDLELTQTTDDPCSSSELNKNIESSDKSSQDSRDTNYNIKNNEEVPASSAPMRRYSRLHSPRFGRMASTPTNEESGSKMLKRFSQEFMSSPQRFTEKLLTIIDESESTQNYADNTGVNLSCMTREFRKMCKFIQDESMPEHLNSTFGISKHLEEKKNANFQRPETIEESPIDVSSDGDAPNTPEGRVFSPKACQKTPVNRFKKLVGENNECISPDSLNSTRFFVSLEKRLNEETSSPRTQLLRENSRSTSGSDISAQLRDKMRIVEKSEQQMADLEETNHIDFDTFDSHRAHGTQEREVCENERIESNPNDLPPVDDEALDEDELSMSLRLELEKQRERCFETARQMQKIEEDAKACNEDFSKVLERFGIDPEVECRKTIESLMNYQNCRAKIRQNERTKKQDMSSMDSGIDTRSISRTLQGSRSKKSYNTEASSRGFGKASQRSQAVSKPSGSENVLRSSALSSRSGLNSKKTELKKAATPKTKAPTTPRLYIDSRRRSPGELCPTARALAQSRSKSGEKKLSSNRSQSNIQTCRTPQTNRTDDKSTNPMPSKVLCRQADKSEIFEIFQSCNKQQLNSRNEPFVPSTNVESPISRYHLAPPTSSPITKLQNVDRMVKITKSPRTQTPSPITQTKSPKHRFFVTPGKSVPVKPYKRLKPLFVNEDVDPHQSNIHRIIKSPHAPGIFRNGLGGNVISPVRTYILGTDMNLIQNVQAKTNEMLLTPTKAKTSEEKLMFDRIAKKSTPRNSPRRFRIPTHQKDFESQSDCSDENQQKPDFLLAKANYELPSRVHTIDQSPKSIGGARTRGLLKAMQNRVVIRHEGKVFGNFDEHEVPESGSDSADMSIHVQRSAEKTNYATRWA
ncbi:uncharacterized protein [Venturia canescens]|nr:uncharacterized protein LOC122419228 isoform X2 [Venturia canescens]